VPGDADDMSWPGSVRWRCPCWLGSGLIVRRLHFHVNCLKYLLYSRGVHWYGSPDLPLGRLLCGIRSHLGPLACIA